MVGELTRAFSLPCAAARAGFGKRHATPPAMAGKVIGYTDWGTVRAESSPRSCVGYHSVCVAVVVGPARGRCEATRGSLIVRHARTLRVAVLDMSRRTGPGLTPASALVLCPSSSGPRQHRPLRVGVRGCGARHRPIGVGRRVGHLHHRLVASWRRRARAAHSVEEPHQVRRLFPCCAPLFLARRGTPSAVLPLLRGCALGRHTRKILILAISPFPQPCLAA